MRKAGTGGSSLRELQLPKRGALLATTVLIMLGLAILYINTYEMAPSLLPGYPGDAFFPRLVLGFTAICGLIILGGGLLRAAQRGDEDDTQPAQADRLTIDWLETAIIAALVIAYMQLLRPIGFEITTTVFLGALLARRLFMPWPRALLLATLIGAATTLVLYLVFGLGLKVAIPLLFLPLYLY
ncbi:tripartite tricarboxylate transporter TctB family protein [Afifella pfennigii]|uniref:tripartite tricarboxylate transporter TctB family protein n=1 Tax=Afifella pfennigii TaxID=209897 RepID=UPI000558C21C|nr:tripartite tricarboxylate transporter TctB family protein [Afifella pfennigii]